ncbi:hypothetical protein ACTXT7_008289 [Hymenolepis weldensis]
MKSHATRVVRRSSGLLGSIRRSQDADQLFFRADPLPETWTTCCDLMLVPDFFSLTVDLFLVNSKTTLSHFVGTCNSTKSISPFSLSYSFGPSR